MKVVAVVFNQTQPASRAQTIRLENVAESFFQITPQVALCRPMAIVAEVGQCERLYSPTSAMRRLEILARKFDPTPRVALADDVPTALALAHFGISERAHLPLEALDFYASPFEQIRQSTDMIEQLHRLGVHTLEQFLSLPFKSLASRFGQKGSWTAYCVREAQKLVWPRWSPGELLQEQVEVDGLLRVQNLEGLQFFLKTALDRLVSRLRGRGQKLLKLEVTLQQELYSTVSQPQRKIKIEFSAPQGHSLSLLKLLRERIDRELSQNPLESEVVGLKVEALEVLLSGFLQRDFFLKKEEEHERLESLIGRLEERLGETKAFQAQIVHRFLPEGFWKKKPAIETNAQTNQSTVDFNFPLRPLRLLKEPETLIRARESLCTKWQQWEVTRWEGPEVLSGEWWQEGGFERHYYRVYTRQGDILWIFQDPFSRDIYLHGLFD